MTKQVNTSSIVITQTPAQSARQVLCLLSDYAVRNELEKFFAREWEIATGLSEKREEFEAENLKLEERIDELITDKAGLRSAARDVCRAWLNFNPADKESAKELKAAMKELENLT